MDRYVCEPLSETSYDTWDEFVGRSPQGTVFNTTVWYQVLHEVLGKHWILYGCHKKGSLCGGCIIVRSRRAGLDLLLPPLFTPYQGFVLRPRLSPRTSAEVEDVLRLVSEMEKEIRRRHSMAVLVHHPTMMELRPLVWSNWEAIPRYTFRLRLDPSPEAFAALRYDVRNRVRRAHDYGLSVRAVADIADYAPLYAASYGRHGQAPPVPVDLLTKWFLRLRAEGVARGFLAVDSQERPHALRIVIIDGRMAYDWVAGADTTLIKQGAPSLLVWRINEELSRECDYLDFMGANTPSIAAFKAGFGAPLTMYWETRMFRFPLLRALLSWKERIFHLRQ
ncbi:MAG: GNAT family N-acetyltransferase [Candidatus Eisenbacteria bacterium]